MQQLTLNNEQEQEIARRGTVWGNFGRELGMMDIQLAHDALLIPNTFPLPTDINSLPEYDKQLAELKRNVASIKERRLATTNKFNPPIERLMSHEKTGANWIEQYQSALLVLKQQAEADRQKKQARINELAQLRHACELDYNELQARCARIVTDKVTELYTRALDKDAIVNGDVMDAMKRQLTEQSFAFAIPTDQDEEKQAIYNEVYGAHTPATFVANYHEQLNTRFINFEADKLHKVEAMAQARYEQDTANSAIIEQQSMMNVAAAMSVDATPTVDLEHKGLKQVFEIDMPDNAMTMQMIDKAFIGLDGYNKIGRVKSLWNISMQQKAAYIAKCKCDDNGMQISGITFKTVTKL